MTGFVHIGNTEAVATIGDRIRAARLREGWSQTAFAKEVGCSLPQLKKLESATTYPKGSIYIAAIERMLGLDLQSDVDPGVSPGDPDNPLLSEATELQLANALARRIAARTGTQRHDQSNVEPIQVRGMDWNTESSGTADGGGARA